MVDPMNITIYDRNDRQLQEFLIFCICVAGKTAQTTALAVERFLNILSYEDPDPICKGCTLRPLTLIGLFSESEIAEAMRQAGLGCYYQRSVALKRLATMWQIGRAHV